MGRMKSFFAASLLAPALAVFQKNCFRLLEEPLAEAPFKPDEVGKLLQHFRMNIDVNGTGAIIASPGATPALPPSCEGGYKYHWTRDGAISMSTMVKLGDALGLPESHLEQLSLSYANWVQKLHENGTTAFLEPKWVIEKASPYELPWCKPQSDGPPLRARVLMQMARRFPSNAGLFWELASKDLDWLVSKTDGKPNIEITTCDLWEETTDSDFFWNQAVMRAALLEGIDYSRKVGDQARGQAYSEALHDYLRRPLSRHVEWSLFGSYATECPTLEFWGTSCRKYRLDSAALL
ncbi:unnamed protein product [Effrenium voratum]|uniref:glucan 1,4-alpha-glucosidase n=1 Tax=Effrenium voratum TaxID=2562239 RepID=A0AA36HPD6_9DINO|nr:unnamed protein product [Effrenium voratum]